MFVATGDDDLYKIIVDKTEAPRLPWVPLSIADISSLVAGTLAKALKEMLDAAEAPATLEVHYLVVHPGPESAIIPRREETLQRMENVVDVLNQVAQRCHALGRGCVLENKLPHLPFGRTSDILWILDALESVEVAHAWIPVTLLFPAIFISSY